MNSYQSYHQVQMRFSAEDVVPGMEIFFRGKSLMLGTLMPQTLAHDNVPVGGYSMQFELLHNGRRAGAAWFYYYRSFEDVQWAVLDEMTLAEAADSSAQPE